MVEGRGEGPGGMSVGSRTKMGEADTSENPSPSPPPPPCRRQLEHGALEERRGCKQQTLRREGKRRG